MRENPIRSLLRRPEAAIMGIINATPDSFSDGGKFSQFDSAVKHGLQLVEEGADILDIGGESTRPGANLVSVDEELSRVIPIIEKLACETDIPISIDTYKPEVMRAAVLAGAQMINDVNGLRTELSIKTVAELEVPACIMHMQGQPKNMQSKPHYDNVVADVITFFNQQVESCKLAGIPDSDIMLDPGIGFGKTLSHNLCLLNSLPEIIQNTACQVLIGVSRKSLIQKQLGRALDLRLPASLGLAVQAVLNGAKILRVHDVRASYDAIRMVEAVKSSK